MHENLTEILKLCKQMGASDIHLRVNSPPIYRVASKLIISSGIPLKFEDLKAFLISIANKKILKKFELNSDVDFSVSLPGISRFRVNCFLEMGKLAFVFRQIPFELPTIDQLKIPEVMVNAVQRKSGLYLLCGPTGSGKSTTIAALLQFINENYRYRVITLEDPIEFLFKDTKSEFIQRELGKDFASFPEALRGVLRQDPDVIMVGEMRDMETIDLALMAAETGHLVISTLHASSSYSAINRILGVFPGDSREFIRNQLASVIIGTTIQALLPMRDNPEARVVAREILVNTPAISNLIRNNKQEQIPMFLDAGKNEGMTSMNHSLEMLVRRKIVSPSIALPYSMDPEALMKKFESLGILHD